MIKYNLLEISIYYCSVLTINNFKFNYNLYNQLNINKLLLLYNLYKCSKINKFPKWTDMKLFSMR